MGLAVCLKAGIAPTEYEVERQPVGLQVILLIQIYAHIDHDLSLQPTCQLRPALHSVPAREPGSCSVRWKRDTARNREPSYDQPLLASGALPSGAGNT